MGEYIVTIICAMLGSGALTAFLQYLIGRHDSKAKDLKEIKAAISEIKEEQNNIKEENRHQNAMVARSTIIAFDDELTFENKKYSRERFLQMLEACEVYENWSKQHPEVQNGYGKAAAKHIREVYQDNLSKGVWKI